MTKELKGSATVSLDCITRHFVDFPLFLVQANAKHVPSPRNNTMRGKGTEAGVLFALYVKTACRSICPNTNCGFVLYSSSQKGPVNNRASSIPACPNLNGSCCARALSHKKQLNKAIREAWLWYISIIHISETIGILFLIHDGKEETRPRSDPSYTLFNSLHHLSFENDSSRILKFATAWARENNVERLAWY